MERKDTPPISERGLLKCRAQRTSRSEEKYKEAMATLATKANYPSSLGMGHSQTSMVSQYPPSYRKPVGGGDQHTGSGQFLSPTESEFSVTDGDGEAIKGWDERKVGEWLRAINCSQYEQLFKGTALITLPL